MPRRRPHFTICKRQRSRCEKRHERLIFKAGFTSKYAKDGTPSTGLGLVYVKQMTEQLGGSIQFINLSPSPGVQFTIDLPMSTLMGIRTNMRFYIIDDDEVFRSMLAEIIEDNDLGEVIGEAEDGIVLNDQSSLLQQIDILFIDLLMPIQDGIETVRKIKDTFKGKIIMMSQVETKDLIGKAYSLGIEYYITKPLNRMEVLMVIQK